MSASGGASGAPSGGSGGDSNGGTNAGGSAGSTGCTPTDPNLGSYLFSNQADPSVIAVDGTYVYWVNTSGSAVNLQRGPKAGGCPETLRSAAFAASVTIRDMFVDATGVYVASTDKQRALVKFNKTTGEDIFKTQCLNEGYGVAGHNETHAFYACADSEGRIVGVRKSDGVESMRWPYPDTFISGIAGSPSYVYFTFHNGSLERVGTDAKGAQALNSSLPYLRVSYGTKAWALSATTVFTYTEGGVTSTPTSSLVGAKDIIATGDTAVVLQRDANDKTSIVQISPVKTYDLTVKDPGGFAVDGTYLYVTDKEAGEIVRVAR